MENFTGEKLSNFLLHNLFDDFPETVATEKIGVVRQREHEQPQRVSWKRYYIKVFGPEI